VMERRWRGSWCSRMSICRRRRLFNDFFRRPRWNPRDTLGTVGLWSGCTRVVSPGGMHHLECQFDSRRLREQMESQGGVKVMKPFHELPYFAAGVHDEASAGRCGRSVIAALLRRILITMEQPSSFGRTERSMHLENLERTKGSGFNQSGVNEIISATDPRKHMGPSRLRQSKFLRRLRLTPTSALIQLLIHLARLQQLRVLSLPDDLPLLQNDDRVGRLNRAETDAR